MYEFNPIPAQDIIDLEPGPQQWIWKDFIPPGTLVLFSGFMKTGKSTFIYPLAVSVAQGRPFLGYETSRGAVLILSLEERRVDVRNRLIRFGMQHQDALSVHCGPLHNDTQSLNNIMNFIVQNHVVLVIVDTLSLFWTVSDENNNAMVVQQIKPILELARITGCSICLVHHTNKAGGDRGRDIRGASSLLGIVDQSMVLEDRQGGKSNQRVLKTLGRFDESPPELILELQDDEWKNLGTGAEAIQKNQNELVLRVLTHDPQTVDMVALKTDLSSQKQVRRSLKILTDQGRVVETGEGKKGDPHAYQLA